MPKFAGSDPLAMASLLTRLSETYTEFTVDTLCLFIQEHDEANWQVYREFPHKSTENN